MQIQPILGYFGAIFGLYQPPAPPFGSWHPVFTYPGSAPAKDGSLLINTLASNICFSYRNMFQNGVDALSKIVDAFLSKSSKFHLVRIIWKCSNFGSLWHKHLLRNYKWHFRLPMSAFATAIWNTLSKHQLFTLNFAFQLFHVSIAIDNCRSQKYHL